MSEGTDTDSADGYTLTLTGGKDDVPTFNDDNDPNGVVLTATLTNTQDGTPYSDKSITFTIRAPEYNDKKKANEQPYLDPGCVLEYTTPTNLNGQAQVTVYAGGEATTVAVDAAYTTYQQDTLNPQNVIEFVRPKVDKLVAMLDPDKKAMEEIIKVIATVTSKGKGKKGVEISMSLAPNPNGALFCNELGVPNKENHSNIVKSDADGKAVAYITSPLWGSGEVSINLKDPDETIDEQKPEYIFEYNNAVCVNFEETKVKQGEPPVGKDNGSDKATGNSGSDAAASPPASAPADGMSYLEIGGWVTLAGEPLKGNPYVTLHASGSRASFAGHDQEYPNKVTTQCGSQDGKKGHFSAKLSSTLPEDGKVSVTIERSYDAQGNPVVPQPESNTVAYSFVDPWCAINNFVLRFANSESNYSIYANGLHQAPVVMSFDLCATQEVVLPDNACPSVDDLIKQVTLLDYYSGESIVPLANSSTPVSTGWGFGSNPNAWDKGSIGASATVAILDVNQSSIVNGRATLYFYIQCGGNPLPSPLTLGAMIKPTGYQLKDGHLVQGSVVSYSLGHKAPAQLIQVTPVLPPQLGPDSLICTGTPFVAGGRQNEKGPANIASNPEYKANYYRQFDYTIQPSAAFKDAHKITKVTFSAVSPDKLPNDYCYSSQIQNLYDYRLYLWPKNISGLENKKSPGRDGSYSMKGNIDYGAKFNQQLSSEGVFNVTRYIAFGAPCKKQYIQTDINLVMTDNYGNTYPFYLPADTAAPTYDPAAMKDWNPVSIGAGTRNSSNTDSAEANYTVGGVGGMNISKRIPVVANPPASASDPDLLYQNISGDKSPLSMSITLNQTYNMSQQEYISPVFYMTFVSDDNCMRSIIYDDKNYNDKLVCAPQSWTSATTVRGVTLRPIWSTGKFIIGVNPNLDTNPTGEVRYAAISTRSGDMIQLAPWSDNDQTLIWQVGTG